MELEATFTDIQDWFNAFLVRNGKSKLSNQVDMRAANSYQQKSNVFISNILATEEMMWSAKWGLKGATDATVEVQLNNKSKSEVMPLELKTGKRSYAEMEHRGQVSLYTLMLAERYEKQTDRGILLYLIGPQTEGVVLDMLHLRGLIQTRNHLAVSLSKLVDPKTDLLNEKFLPPMLNRHSDCKRCFQLQECMLYHAASENGSAETRYISPRNQ